MYYCPSCAARQLGAFHGLGVAATIWQSWIMRDKAQIRESRPDDLPMLEQLYRSAFPEEELVPLLRQLLAESEGVLSLVAVLQGEVVGHVCFTACTAGEGGAHIALLAPLAVDPDHQRRGLGGGLVHAGLEASRAKGAIACCVLGDPNYYSRFGFEAETGIEAPDPLPAEWHGAWQSLGLVDPAPAIAGKLSVPAPWQKRELWTE